MRTRRVRSCGHSCPLGLDQFLDRAPQQGFAAERHAQRTDLARVDLVLRAAIDAGDPGLAPRKLLGNAGYLLLSHMQVIAVECLPGDGAGVSRQKQINGPGDIRSMDFFATPDGLDRLAPQDLADEIKPA